MDTYSSIFTRASTRKFDSAPLSAQALEDFETFITGVKPLVPEVKLTHKIVGADGVKGLALPKAPHYLLISGEGTSATEYSGGLLLPAGGTVPLFQGVCHSLA